MPSRAAKDRPLEYCRESDSARPLTGLPRLPSKVWARFLLDEASAFNQGVLGVPLTPF
jgi:hypothetical protein